MYIPTGHFLSDYVVCISSNKFLAKITSVDTDLMVATRITGFDQNKGEPIIDLIKIDYVFFDLKDMTGVAKEILPEESDTIRLFDSSKFESRAEALKEYFKKPLSERDINENQGID